MDSPAVVFAKPSQSMSSDAFGEAPGLPPGFEEATNFGAEIEILLHHQSTAAQGPNAGVYGSKSSSSATTTRPRKFLCYPAGVAIISMTPKPH